MAWTKSNTVWLALSPYQQGFSEEHINTILSDFKLWDVRVTRRDTPYSFVVLHHNDVTDRLADIITNL